MFLFIGRDRYTHIYYLRKEEKKRSLFRNEGKRCWVYMKIYLNEIYYST